MSTEDNKALARRLNECWNQGNLGEADVYFTPNFVYHDVANPQVSNREDYKQFLSNFHAAFPGQFTIEDLIAEGEKVASRYTFHGTHQGQWRGVPPTGKAMTFTGTVTYHIGGDKIVEAWQNADNLSVLRQLGLFPA